MYNNWKYCNIMLKSKYTMYTVQRYPRKEKKYSKKRKIIYTKAKHCKQDRQNDFLGIGRLYDPSYTRLSKFLWCIIISICFIACLYQIVLRASFYFEGVVTLEVEFKTQTTFEFPSITWCNPENFPPRYETTTQKHEMKTNTNDQKSAIGEVKLEDLSVEILCAEQTENKCKKSVNESMTIDFVNTVFGKCIMLSLKNKMVYRGVYTYVKFFWNHSSINNNAVSMMNNKFLFFLQNDKYKHSHDGILISENALVNWTTNYRIYAKELINLNSYRNPCISAEESVKCLNECIEKQLSTVLTCNLFGFKSTQRQCSSLDEYVKNFARGFQVFINASQYFEKCQCKRKCNEVKYTLDKDDESLNLDNITELHLLYADDTHQTIRERVLFSTSALFSDIGGTIGFYLGLSIFTAVDFIESAIRRSFFKVKT